MSNRVVLATANPGKLRELAELLAPSGIEVVAQAHYQVAPVSETGATFVENALHKARQASAASGLAAIADDSGLVVDALDGRPGVHSARFAGPHASDRQNLERLLDCLRGVPELERGAHFVCVVVHLRGHDDPRPIVCDGSWSGRILRVPRGEHGFGYDPVFGPDDAEGSAAELEPAVKNRLSHRAAALRQLVRRLTGG